MPPRILGSNMRRIMHRLRHRSQMPPALDRTHFHNGWRLTARSTLDPKSSEESDAPPVLSPGETIAVRSRCVEKRGL
jgi:hypothetical protein